MDTQVSTLESHPRLDDTGLLLFEGEEILKLCNVSENTGIWMVSLYLLTGPLRSLLQLIDFCPPLQNVF
jgi:hypothetical protein